MSNSKKNKFAIQAKILPENVYKILNEKASKHALTSYIIELVQEKESTELILKELKNIENKIDNLSPKSIIVKEKAVNEDKLIEGNIVKKVDNVESGIDDDDLNGEGDF
ncbi:hypothetical protein [Clostridium guangxiense]|uniref:hypothetical protein n=1 Tax=Clostridium guangxiense TaxID=1662055 RepID=UPI001E4E82B4|nr:hypothetical protein [Clostridium guangxiense]MCD2345095.1 hypothetical protein [Clostridium guangxiense]